ncbi:clathrin heavy chain [Guillardia theta CCMP2712]|uniref:Clathrin heavy chain n=1 Tax=Guillardia theta (strain CCMP2712) TaxID=905079 RepID=L1J231_GUITC|nr:clathrin heavy chain [Guillardia theta CCMP2712]EKX42588.1 clathrin heavy chain [Guillardia theta CCMP2712]|eukprot:XP_005829568.1 clathrin heavy chain [Guillardia theta CCMP2712]
MAAPIKLNEVLKIPALGIRADAISFANCTMESEKFITVREQAGEQVMIHIVDLFNPARTEKRPITADAALMNPVAKILALKSGQALQIFNIELKSKMKAHNMPEPVVYWKWINERTMALVTANAVFHWSMDGTSEPVKVFDRLPQMSTYQIINYRADAAEKWMVLTGIAQAQDGSGRIVGNMQLYSAEKQQSQSIEGHAAAFSQFLCQGATEQSTLFAFANKSATGTKLHIIEVVKGNSAMPFQKRAVDITVPADAANDFPVAMQVSDKYGLVFLVSKFGYIYVFDVETGTQVFMNRISAETIFTTCVNSASGGLLGINRLGQVLHVQIDDQNIVKFLNLNQYLILLQVAARGKLPGAEQLYAANFDQLLRSGDIQGAAEMAAKSPNGVLRTPNTINKFKTVASQNPGGQNPLLIYFSKILEDSSLNAVESVELARPVIGQGKQQLLQKWFDEGKLECSEDLGDLIKQVDGTLALKVYNKANCPGKVIACFVETQQYDKILAYAQRVGYQPEWTGILANMVVLNPEGAVRLAQMLVNQEGGSKIDVAAVAELFLNRNMLQQTTSFLLDALKGNKPEEAALQTKLLEINLRAAPQVAEAILSNGMLTHYDRATVGQLCERAGLFQRALEHFTELKDLKRVIVYASQMQAEFLLEWFGTLDTTWAIDLLKEMLAKDMRSNLQICVQVATKYSEFMTPSTLIGIFEEFKSMEGLYYYLGAIVNFSQDETVHYKYIVACAKVGMMKNDFKELERITRESQYYPAVKVKDFLKSEAKLADPRPLINVCDKHDMVEELTQYLYGKSMMKYIEVYVQKVNPFKTPQVVGALIDAGCPEDQIRSLVMSVRNQCPVEPLIASCQKRNRLRFLLPWLEARFDEGEQDPALHNALAMIYIDTNQNPEKFLASNSYYDHKVVGAYCAKRDPHLAFVVYSSAPGGLCDDEAIAVTNENALYKAQAKFLVERQDLDLWAKVLTDENKHKRALVDQVVSTALPSCRNSEAVACTVKAFMTANLPNELIELLEKIVLRPDSEFAANKNLQNLLILTAVQVAGDLPEEHKGRVMEYINRLDKFDGADIASICVSEGLYEEAFVIYKKFDDKKAAIGVLLENIRDLERAKDFATACNLDETWSTLANAQLNAGQVADAIDSYVKAKDPSDYLRVIEAAQNADQYHPLIIFLQMARKKDFGTQEARSVIDTAMLMSYARTNMMSELEEFVSSPNIANVEEVGERCAEMGMFEAARMLFSSISKHDKLASCLVRLQKYADAVEAARKANFTRTWKEVLVACVDAEEFRLAQMCGLNLMIIPDEIEELMKVYERRGHFEQLIAMLETGLGTDMGGNSSGIFTELAILYVKYKESKLMDHLKQFFSRMNIPRVIRECERYENWQALCFLYVQNDEADNAALTMMNHAADAWEHTEFKSVLVRCANPENLYKAVQFYVEEHPMELNDLLISMSKKEGMLDHSRVVVLMKRKLPLIKEYLEHVQHHDMKSVNEALNNIYIEEEDYEKLDVSVSTYTNYDQLELAGQLQKHPLLEMRRVAGTLYTKNKRYGQALELSKKDKLYKDAMHVAATSQDPELVEQLLRFFVEVEAKECFAACLFTCFELVRPDVVMELAWRNNIMDYAMPYVIQVTKNYTAKVDQLVIESEKKKEEDKKHQEAMEQQAGMGVDMSMQGGPLMLTMGPGMDAYSQMGGGMGMNMGGMATMGGMGMPGMSVPNMGSMPGMGMPGMATHF